MRARIGRLMVHIPPTGREGIRKVVFDHRHPVNGFVLGVKEQDSIRFTGRWPFDRETGEEIYVSTTVATPDYAACLEMLSTQGEGCARGGGGGFIEFVGRATGGTRFEVAADAAASGTRLSLNLADDPRPLANRLLGALNAPTVEQDPS